MEACWPDLPQLLGSAKARPAWANWRPWRMHVSLSVALLQMNFELHSIDDHSESTSFERRALEEAGCLAKIRYVDTTRLAFRHWLIDLPK
jgi:hypothetical protein